MADRTQDGASLYDPAFYAWQSGGSLASARRVAPLVNALLAPRAVLDVGCGLGTWLKAFSDIGVADVLGIDGDYVERSALLVPPDRFVAADLRSPPPLDRVFDLAVSLEVAEHLPAEHASAFVRYLGAAAPAVLFSAAIPGQGGRDHVNEQWQDYWRAKFAEIGYAAVDAIRPRIWGCPDVAVWYQQNMVLYCAPRLLRAPLSLQPVPDGISLDLVHPELYSVVRDRGVMDFGKALKLLPELAVAAARRRFASHAA
jgi:SAM-dependent methyltransferase